MSVEHGVVGQAGPTAVLCKWLECTPVLQAVLLVTQFKQEKLCQHCINRELLMRCMYDIATAANDHHLDQHL